MIKIGEKFGSFMIKAEIGRGGMGTIYHAIDTMLNREVALKIIHPQFADNLQLMERFKIEAMTQARMNHTNIVMIYSFTKIENDYVIVMEYVHGRSLKEILKDKKRLPVEDALEYARQILEGLKYSHARNVIHRDIKPANILIGQDNRVKISDFGIAKVFGTEGMTKTGILVGTPWYTSPEQILGREIDFRADLYSLGVTMYETMTGRVPFDSSSNSEFQIQRAHLEATPTRPSQFNSEISADVERFLLKALQKRGDKRYQSAQEMEDVLVDLLPGRKAVMETTPGLHGYTVQIPTSRKKTFFTPLRVVGSSILLLMALLVVGLVTHVFKLPKSSQTIAMRTQETGQRAGQGQKDEKPIKTENASNDIQTLPGGSTKEQQTSSDAQGKPAGETIPNAGGQKPGSETKTESGNTPTSKEGDKATNTLPATPTGGVKPTDGGKTQPPPPLNPTGKEEKNEAAKTQTSTTSETTPKLPGGAQAPMGVDAMAMKLQQMISKNMLELAEKDAEKYLSTNAAPRLQRMTGLVKFLLDKYPETEEYWKKALGSGEWIELQMIHPHPDNTECGGVLKFKRGQLMFNSQKADHSFWFQTKNLDPVEVRAGEGMAFIPAAAEEKKNGFILRLRDIRNREGKEKFLVEFLRKYIF